VLRQTVQLATRRITRSTAAFCDSTWFRLAIVVMLTCLFLPVPRVRAMMVEDDVKFSINTKPGIALPGFFCARTRTTPALAKASRSP
jgi:hypothetical protein